MLTEIHKTVCIGADPDRDYEALPSGQSSLVYCYINTEIKRKHQAWVEGQRVTVEKPALGLSIKAVVGPRRNGDCFGSCGQCVDSVARVTRFANGWDAEKLAKFIAIWQEWHLNDMRGACEHQRELWDLKKPLEVVTYTWSSRFHTTRSAAADGRDVPENWRQIVDDVFSICTVPSWKRPTPYPEELIQRLLAEDWIMEQKRELKTAGWVYPAEHPDGLLCKPCPACNYPYGSAWLFKELPEDVLQFLTDLPEVPAPVGWPNHK